MKHKTVKLLIVSAPDRSGIKKKTVFRKKEFVKAFFTSISIDHPYQICYLCLLTRRTWKLIKLF